MCRSLSYIKDKKGGIVVTKDSVLAILRNAGDYVSGEKISKLLGVSRSAVNLAIY